MNKLLAHLTQPTQIVITEHRSLFQSLKDAGLSSPAELQFKTVLSKILDSVRNVNSTLKPSDTFVTIVPVLGQKVLRVTFYIKDLQAPADLHGRAGVQIGIMDIHLNVQGGVDKVQQRDNSTTA